MSARHVRPAADTLATDPSAELGLRSPVRDKQKLGDEQYSTTPPREELRPPDPPADADRCTQCSASLAHPEAVRSDAGEYDYYFCNLDCRERWQRDRVAGSPAAADR